MRRYALAALIFLPLPVTAQEQGKPGKNDPTAEYKTLVDDLDTAIKAWRTEVGVQMAAAKAKAAAEKKEAEIPALAKEPPTKEFIGRAQELAEKYEGTEDAVPFLVFIVTRGNNETNAMKKAFQTLMSDHIASPKLGEVAGRLEELAPRFLGADSANSLFDELLEKNQDHEVQARVHLARGKVRMESANTDEQRAAGVADLKQVAQLTKDPATAESAKGLLFEVENLQVGNKAPDIEGKDTEGVAFKLSDYRGKVVLLDFWGFW